jgi:hypothetical protein
MVEKSDSMTTMDISMENKGKLHGIAEQLEKITGKAHISLDEALSVELAIRPLDVILQEIMLEDRPEWTSDKKSRKKK